MTFYSPYRSTVDCLYPSTNTTYADSLSYSFPWVSVPMPILSFKLERLLLVLECSPTQILSLPV